VRTGIDNLPLRRPSASVITNPRSRARMRVGPLWGWGMMKTRSGVCGAFPLPAS